MSKQEKNIDYLRKTFSWLFYENTAGRQRLRICWMMFPYMMCLHKYKIFSHLCSTYIKCCAAILSCCSIPAAFCSTCIHNHLLGDQTPLDQMNWLCLIVFGSGYYQVLHIVSYTVNTLLLPDFPKVIKLYRHEYNIIMSQIWTQSNASECTLALGSRAFKNQSLEIPVLC